MSGVPTTGFLVADVAIWASAFLGCAYVFLDIATAGRSPADRGVRRAKLILVGAIIAIILGGTFYVFLDILFTSIT